MSEYLRSLAPFAVAYALAMIASAGDGLAGITVVLLLIGAEVKMENRK